MEIDAETPETRNAVGRISDLRFPVELQRLRRERGKNCGFNFGAVERSGFELAYFPLEAQTGRGIGYQEQIAPSLLNQCGEPAIK
jgi:hypothetical protein